MKKIFYVLLIALALVALNFTVVLADSNSPDCTDTPQPPPIEETVPPPVETPLPPPTETSEATITPSEPISEPTPTIEAEPTPTKTNVPGKSSEKNKKPPTPVETLPVTGVGEDFRSELLWTLILTLVLVGTLLMVWVIRREHNL